MGENGLPSAIGAIIGGVVAGAIVVGGLVLVLAGILFLVK